MSVGISLEFVLVDVFLIVGACFWASGGMR